MKTCRGEMPETRDGLWYTKCRKRERKGWVVHRWGLWMGSGAVDWKCRRTVGAGLLQQRLVLKVEAEA